jgi:hypothetical protein
VRVVARPASPFTFDYRISVGGVDRGRVRHRAFGRPGTMTLDGTEYDIRRNGPFAWSAQIHGVPGDVVSATRVGRLRTRTQLTWPAGALLLRRAGLGAATDLVEGDAVVGRMRPRTLFTRTLIVDAPDSIPLPAVGMCIWLAARARRAAMTSTS